MYSRYTKVSKINYIDHVYYDTGEPARIQEGGQPQMKGSTHEQTWAATNKGAHE